MKIIPVTRSDLDSGSRSNSRFCPVARVMQRAEGHPHVRIFHGWFTRHYDHPRGTIHPALVERIELFDDGATLPDPFTVLDTGNELRLGPA